MYSFFFFFSSRRRHTRYIGDWSSDVCSSDLINAMSEGHDHGVDGFAANPGLNAKPAASDQSSENRGNIRAECTERSAGKNGRSEERRVGKECRSRGSRYQ